MGRPAACAGLALADRWRGLRVVSIDPFVPTGEAWRLGQRLHTHGAMPVIPRIPVSWGELIDKITILEIKVERLQAPAAAAHARGELALLIASLAGLAAPAALASLRAELSAVN